MKVAVTGAGGFIGRHVIQELGRCQVDICAVLRNASLLKDMAPAVRAVEMDIALPDEDCFTKMGRPDVLIHLAWEGLPNYKSLHHYESELPRHYNFLKALVDAGLTTMFVAGTCFEYGMRSGALSETVMPFPNNPYGYAKHSLQRQLAFLKTEEPFNLTWGRLFYLYGEGQSGSGLYPSLRDAVQRGDKVFQMSGGEQLRDYLPVAEVARLIVRLALSGRDSGTVNVCSGEPISVRRLVESWIQQNNWTIKPNFGHYPYPDYEPMAFWGDRHRLNDILESV